MPDTTRQHATSERRLVVIMFANIIGYMALMGKESSKELEADLFYGSACYGLGITFMHERN